MKRILIVLLLLVVLAGIATPFVTQSFENYFGTDDGTTAVITEPSVETTTEAPVTKPVTESTTKAPESTTAETTTAETTTAETATDESTTLAGAANESTTSESTTEEKTTYTPIPSIPSEQPGTILGASAKGYDIIEVNGLTYINGILVVNKTYSVPENYNPGELTADCKKAFREMQAAAEELGLELKILSGYRSYETQENLYNKYCEKDGKELADTYSARPGHSEHQTGLAIDVNSVLQSFKNTPEGKWLKENCYKYGFILRYTEDKQSKTGYSYEPWHIRYVGKAAAKDIYESGLCLEEYLGITSVYA